MKKMLLFALLVLFAGGAQAVWVQIAPASGYSEPLDPGDYIMVSDSGDFPGDAYYSDGWFTMHYHGNDVGEVRFTDHNFTISGGQITGQEPLNVDTYTWADEVGFHIAYISAAHQYHNYSDNLLQVNWTTLPTPSLSVWGMIALIAGVSLVLIRRR